jgi:integrative and conjugative element protein (TIGR02256 family)
MRHLDVVSLPIAQCSAIGREAADAAIGDETGGIVMGKLAKSEFSVTLIGPPGPNAIHRPDFFLRDLAHARMLAQDAWDLDRSEWIGEWHTHPHSGLSPSAADVATYRRHLNDPELQFHVFLSFIAKLRGDELLLAAWAVSADNVRRLRVSLLGDL